MFFDDGQNALATLGGTRLAPVPPPAAPLPVLSAVALSTRATSSAEFLGPGLAPGTYGYLLSLLVDGFETPAGAEATVTWAGPGLGEVRVTLPVLPARASGLNVYGRAPLGETMLARDASGLLLPGVFVDQGQALLAQAPVPANSIYKRGGGRVHRLHVPGSGGTLGNVTIIDAPDPSGVNGLTLFGPTTPAAGSIVDLQAPCRWGILVQAPAGMVFAVACS